MTINSFPSPSFSLTMIPQSNQSFLRISHLLSGLHQGLHKLSSIIIQYQWCSRWWPIFHHPLEPKIVPRNPIKIAEKFHLSLIVRKHSWYKSKAKKSCGESVGQFLKWDCKFGFLLRLPCLKRWKANRSLCRYQQESRRSGTTTSSARLCFWIGTLPRKYFGERNSYDCSAQFSSRIYFWLLGWVFRLLLYTGCLFWVSSDHI